MSRKARLRAIARQAPGASDARARALYLEVFGAEVASSVPLERVRASLVEAVAELLPPGESAPELSRKNWDFVLDNGLASEPTPRS